MGIFLFANNAETTLAAPVGPTDGTISVASGTGVLFPNPTGGNMFAVTLQSASNPLLNEICYCTARTGDVLTITRGEESTSPSSFLVGDAAANLWTAGQAESYIQTGEGASLANVQQQTGNSAGDSGTANAGVIALNPTPVSLASMDGAPIRVRKISSPNSTAYTLDFGFGPKEVNLPGGAPFIGGELLASCEFTVTWNNTALYCELQSVNYSIQNAQLADAPQLTLKGNNTGSTAPVADLTVSEVLAMLGLKQVASCYATLSGTTWTVHGNGVSGITHLSTGHGEVTLSPAMPNTTYTVILTAEGPGGANIGCAVDTSSVRTNATFEFETYNGGGIVDIAAINIYVISNT